MTYNHLFKKKNHADFIWKYASSNNNRMSMKKLYRLLGQLTKPKKMIDENEEIRPFFFENQNDNRPGS